MRQYVEGLKPPFKIKGFSLFVHVFYPNKRCHLSPTVYKLWEEDFLGLDEHIM